MDKIHCRHHGGGRTRTVIHVPDLDWICKEEPAPLPTGEGIRDQLRRLIGESGETAASLHQVTGVHEQRLRKFLRGDGDISLDSMERIANKLGSVIVVEPANKEGKK